MPQRRHHQTTEARTGLALVESHCMRGAVPVLVTERLCLRGYRLGDFEPFGAMWADPNVFQHGSGKPIAEQEAWKKFLRQIGHWALMGFGYWVIEEKSSGRFVGEAGFADFKRDLAPSIKGMAEMGWVLASWSHGRGFATEAVRAALSWGATHLEGRPIVCLIAPENLASLRVADKCGFREVQRTTYNNQPTILLRR
jgi:RimJ/RimL family protein N-acetyltransferase